MDGSVGAAALAEAAQIPAKQATLALVLPAHDDPALAANEADLHDVFLYIQSYKSLAQRAHMDSPSVWPSTSIFDGYLSALSPILALSPIQCVFD